MKKLYITLTLLACLALSGCNSTDPYRTGLYSGSAARIGFDSERDSALFGEIKTRIDAFLASERTLTEEIVSAFVAEYQSRISPVVLNMVLADLGARMEVGSYDQTGREFLQGVSDAFAGLGVPTS